MNTTTNLFGETTLAVPKTQGIKYAGSKLKILPSILDVLAPLGARTVLDGFSGSTRVSQALAQCGFHVTASDSAVWSEVFATCFLLNTRPREYYADIIRHLNSLEGYHGWFSEHYGGSADVQPDKSGEKRPFQLHNTRKLDAIRDEIDRMGLDEVEKAVALTSLIFALDSVDNTLGHYAAYLSDWSARSYKTMTLRIPDVHLNTAEHRVVKGDIFDTIGRYEFDVAYFDPPYGSNNDKMPPSRVRYSSYYHIWTTVIKNDKPALFGKVNRRVDTRDSVAASVFEEFRKDSEGSFIAMQAIKRLIEETAARHIVLSYSSGGRATKEELYSILNASGTILKAIEIDYKKNVMGAMRWTNEWITSDGAYSEYLFLLEKS